MSSDNTRIQEAVAGVVAFLKADVTLVGLLGSAERIFFRDTVELVELIPCIALELPDEGLTECFEEVALRAHVWGKTNEVVLTIARRYRLILHGRQVSLNGVTMIPEFLSSGPAPGDKRVGAVRRVVDTRLNVVRQRATT